MIEDYGLEKIQRALGATIATIDEDTGELKLFFDKEDSNAKDFLQLMKEAEESGEDTTTLVNKAVIKAITKI